MNSVLPVSFSPVGFEGQKLYYKSFSFFFVVIFNQKVDSNSITSGSAIYGFTCDIEIILITSFYFKI